MTTQPVSIDTAFAELCAKHGVYVFEISINLHQSAESRFNCVVHHDGPSRFNGCVMAHGATSEEAMHNAIAGLAEDRMADGALPAIVMAAAA